MGRRVYNSATLAARIQALEAERKRLVAEARAAAARERTRAAIIVGATALRLAGVAGDDRDAMQRIYAAIVAGQVSAEDIITRAADAIRRRSAAPSDGSRTSSAPNAASPR